MAFDHGGTFNNHQLARLHTFLTNQGFDVPLRIVHLVAEQARIGALLFTFDAGGNPIGYNASPATSYIGKLMRAYEILGGDPLFDLQIRSMAQPVFITGGSETQPGQQLSSGDILGTPGKRDGISAAYIQQMKAWVPEVIQYKRENIERKIRRAVDYSDQLAAEVQALSMIMNDTKTTGSLADLTTQVQTLLADPTYRPIYNDTSNDYHGKLTHAPFSAFDPGPDTTVNPAYVRVDGGAIVPGQTAPPNNQTPPTTPTTPGQTV